jgi:hypothetical protein
MTRDKDSRQEVIVDLRSHKTTLQRFRDRVNELKVGIGFKSQAPNKLYYCVDFSEIYSYLHYGDPAVHYSGLNFFSSGEDGKIKSELQHYLALTHLFESFSEKPLYLLQPYVLEMYSYARSQAHHFRKSKRTLSELISSVTNGLKPEHAALLKTPDRLSEEQKIELLEIMKADYPRLSTDLLEFERWFTRNEELNTRGQLLKQLLASRKLSHRTDEILKECGIRDAEMEKPSLEEEKKVVDEFPPLRSDEEDRQFSRLVDARALLLLRNMNRLLERHDARLVLITRDMKSPRVAEKLRSWFGWADVKNYFYGIEAVYLDLLLQPVADEQKLEWLNKADKSLKEMLDSVDLVLKETNADESTEISSAARALLEQNSKKWDELVEVQFIRTSPSVEWLGSDFVQKRVLTAAKRRNDEQQLQVKPDESQMLTQLVTFVDSPDFQEVAAEDADKLWNGIAADAFGMNTLGIFSDRLSEVMTQLKTLLPGKADDPEVFRKVIAKSRSFLNMPTIHFENRHYNEFVKHFHPWRYGEAELLDQLGRMLEQLFSHAASNPEKPENCLFMAFVMGMHDFWDPAVEMAENGSERIKERRSEFDYFLAYARYRRVDMHNYAPLEALEQYAQADRDIRAALKANPYDARYLERRGAIALRYHHTVAALPKESHSAVPITDIASVAEARGFLKQAVQRAGPDRKISVRALNNLAYSYGTSDPPELHEAEECIKQIEREFDAATNDHDESLPSIQQWPFVMDTVWYIGARIAYTRGDAESLKQKRELFEVALEKANLLEAEATSIAEHIREIQNWQSELNGAGTNSTRIPSPHAI